MRGRSVHAKLGDGRMIVHNCFTDTDLALKRAISPFLTNGGNVERFRFRQISRREAPGRFFQARLLSILLPKRPTEESPTTLTIPQLHDRPLQKPQKIDMLAGDGGKAAIKMRTADATSR